MNKISPFVDVPASPAQRADALEIVLSAHGLMPDNFVSEYTHAAEELWVSQNGSRVVARAWTDAEFRKRLLSDGKSAVEEMGFGLPPHHRHLAILENTPQIHNVVVCTLCSCHAFTIIGAAPGWYKDLEYRSRIARESRTALREIGLDLPDTIEIRVWDTTADTRYVVLPMQPPQTTGWSAEKLAEIVSQGSMIGTDRLEKIVS